MQNAFCLAAFAPIALATLTFSGSARADVEPDPQHSVSLTFSPIHLILPMLEVQAEFRASPKFGIAGILGFGGVSVSTSDGETSSTSSLFVFEVGAKFAYYAVGDFEEGLQLGVEALYLGISGSGDDDDLSSIFASGVSLSPFVGYKLVADIGFTFEAQIGPALIFATASNDEGESASAVAVGPMINLNIGWSL